VDIDFQVMAEIIPFVFFRTPFCDNDENWKHKVLCMLCCCADEIHVPKRVKVANPKLGACKVVLTGLVVSAVLYYQFVTSKDYLEKAEISSYRRLSLQHPVNDCNPLEADCKAELSPLSKLKYCNRGDLHNGSSGEKAITCKYFDEFDVYKIAAGMDHANFLVPTRISQYTQKINPDCERTTKECTQPFILQDEEHHYVGDIEDYTLLFDHGFVSEEAGLSLDAFQASGFYMNCTKEHDHTFLPSHDDEECPISSIRRDSSKKELARLEHAYNLGKTTVGTMTSVRQGDFIRISDLVSLAGIHLDGHVLDVHNPERIRAEGVVLSVKIKYLNFRQNTWPHSEPPIYMYQFRRINTESFKVTSVSDNADGTRLVKSVHGVYVQTELVGDLGTRSLREIFVGILEICALVGLVHWTMACCALNMPHGDELNAKVDQEFKFHPKKIGKSGDEETGNEDPGGVRPDSHLLE